MYKILVATRFIFTLAFVWVSSQPVLGQLKYDALTTSNGLSQGYIYDILQDSDGFMWFGTKDGLNRYDGYTFKVYTSNNYDPYSISNNNVNRLFEDSKGRLWVLTDFGINVYDKRKDRFYRILHDPKNANSLSGNKINQPVIELPDGRFLVFPEEKNLNVISLPADFPETTVQPVITRLSAPGAYNVTCMYTDGSKKVWIVSDKVYELQPNDLSLVWRKNGFAYFGQTAPAADGGVWGDDIYFSQVQDTNMYPLFTKDITKGHGRVFLHDGDKKWFWLGITDSGRLELYDIQNWQRGAPLDPDKTRLHSIPEVTPTKFYKDKSGLVWMGTNGYGLHKYSKGAEKFRLIAPGLSVRKIMSLPNNQVFVRGWGALKKFDTGGKELTGKAEKELFDGRDFFMGKDFTIWGLHRKNGYSADNFDEVIEKLNLVTNASAVYKINVSREEELQESKMEDSKGHIWLTGFGGRMIVLNPVTGANKKITINTDAANPMLKGAQITALYEDAAGIYWAGTENGLAKINFQFDAVTPKVTWYRTNAADNMALNYSHVTCIINDPADNNYLWVATKGGGLNRLNTTTGQFTHITTKEGLCNDVVYGLLTDDTGNVWGSTNNGIFCLLNKQRDSKGKWFIQHFTKTSGLQDDEFNTGAYARLNNGYLAFGGVNGFNIFDPAVVLKSGFTPNVFITNILVGNQVVTPNDKTGVLQQSIEQTASITLNYLQDILTLEFSSLDFTEPNQNKYRYQLVGIDKDWIESGSRRTVTYLHLPAGSYTFKLQGSNSQGVWSDKVTALKIRVNPPWWLSWWAYVLYTGLIAFAVRSYFKFKVNKAQLQSQLNFEQKEAKRVKELDAVKTQLYANITHEFRTPITVILGMANQVKNEPEKHLKTGMDMIVRNGENLLNLVNEMLDLSKLEDGKMTLHLINSDIISFLRYIVESFQSLAASNQKQFHFLADTDELLVAFDAEKTRQIITNLFSNALKFTPAQGNIYVSVSQEQPVSGKGFTTLVLKVKDTGIGIPESQIPHIFDRFYQLDNSHTRKAEGTGIGLALTKELVKLMNGSIDVKSPPVGATKGTEFIIKIPLQKISSADEEVLRTSFAAEQTKVTAKAAIPAPVIMETAQDREAGPLVLLVEDNADVVAYTASCLADYKLAVGKDGKEGLEIATGAIPDLIITDVMMPYMDGFEMCRKLRQDERTSHIPVIMLTAKADMQSKLEGIEQGADVYLEKPFHKEELLLRIRKLLEQRKALQLYYSRQIGLVTSEEMLPAAVPEVQEQLEHEFVKKVRNIVVANFSNYEFSVEQLCKQVFMSHSQLHRKLEALTGCSPNKFIRIVRLNKAKELLTNPSLSIAAIALDCGYNDAAYFARVFKQEYGKTPQEWRSGNLPV